MTDLTDEQLANWLINPIRLLPNMKFYIAELPSDWDNKIYNRIYNIGIQVIVKPTMIIFKSNKVQVKAWIPANVVEKLSAIEWCKSFINICDGKAGGSKDKMKSIGNG